MGEGSPEKIATLKKSYTGKYLKFTCESSLISSFLSTNRILATGIAFITQDGITLHLRTLCVSTRPLFKSWANIFKISFDTACFDLILEKYNSSFSRLVSTSDIVISLSTKPLSSLAFGKVVFISSCSIKDAYHILKTLASLCEDVLFNFLPQNEFVSQLFSPKTFLFYYLVHADYLEASYLIFIPNVRPYVPQYIFNLRK